MPVVVVGVNHKTAPVAVRERLAFADQTLVESLVQLRHPAIAEVVILSTCNRVEFYLQTSETETGVTGCVDFLALYHGLSASQFVPHLYQLHEAEAVRHLFRV